MYLHGGESLKYLVPSSIHFVIEPVIQMKITSFLDKRGSSVQALVKEEYLLFSGLHIRI